MRLLVGLHHLELGGSQLNALDLALAARDGGHDVVVFAVYQDQPGPVADMARDAGLTVELVRDTEESRGLMPARPAVARRLTQIAARERTDVVHAYEIPLIMDSFYGPHLRLGIPLVCTIYGWWVPWWLPRYPPLIVGAREIVDTAAPLLTQPPVLIEPPVNTDTDTPALVDSAAFRRAHGIDAEIVVAVVSRLEPSMKADGIELAIRAVRSMGDPRIQLVVTGDGPSFAALNNLAEQANSDLGRRAVVMTGALADPRPAYAAADIALGMGGSALRAMAFGKPLIVLGVQGFAKPCRPSTVQEFLFGGFFGVGSGDLSPHELAELIRELADDSDLRSELGAFGTKLIWDRFSLKAASATLENVYATAKVQPRGQRMREAVRVAVSKVGSGRLPGWLKNGLRPVVASRRLLGYRHKDPGL
jgi:glycosyltransferase involved in cell wall biosynthesis